jgi:uncharacterized DUF497 family protein
MRISDFEWDDGNVLHLALRHGIEPEEAEEVLSLSPVVRKTKHGHYAAFGRTEAGRLLVVIFESKPAGVVRVITGWDMKSSEQQYYRRQKAH